MRWPSWQSEMTNNTVTCGGCVCVGLAPWPHAALSESVCGWNLHASTVLKRHSACCRCLSTVRIVDASFGRASLAFGACCQSGSNFIHKDGVVVRRSSSFPTLQLLMVCRRWMVCRTALVRGALLLLGRRRTDCMHRDARHRLEKTLSSSRSTSETTMDIGRGNRPVQGHRKPLTAHYAQTAFEHASDLKRRVLVAVSESVATVLDGPGPIRGRYIDCSPSVGFGDLEHSAVTRFSGSPSLSFRSRG